MMGKEIVMLPLAAMGHLKPMVELGKLLHRHGVSLTILIYKSPFIDNEPIDSYIYRVSTSHPHKTRLHIGQLVKETSTKLKQASETDHYTAVSTSKKITDAKLAKDFQAVLKEFQKAQRLAAERETAYAPFVLQTNLPSSYNASEVDDCTEKTPDQRSMFMEAKRQVVLHENEIIFNEAIIDEREQGIQEIQQQIGEVNDIFKDLAVLVHDQGAVIDDIDSHIDHSLASTAQGKTQLLKASKTQKSKSSLICLLLVIFGVILLIVIIVLAI